MAYELLEEEAATHGESLTRIASDLIIEAMRHNRREEGNAQGRSPTMAEMGALIEKLIDRVRTVDQVPVDPVENFKEPQKTDGEGLEELIK